MRRSITKLLLLIEKKNSQYEKKQTGEDYEESYDLPFLSLGAEALYPISIPLTQFRDGLSEIPKDWSVYLYCRSGQGSYNMDCALSNLGYENIVNIDGSFLGLSKYKYFNDGRLNREPIVIDYNFN